MPAHASPQEKPVATSLKLPAATKRASDAAAQAKGQTPHAYMVAALQQTLEQQRLRDAFDRDTQEAWREVEETGMGHRFEDVRACFAQMAEYRAGRAERPARLQPQKLA